MKKKKIYHPIILSYCWRKISYISNLKFLFVLLFIITFISSCAMKKMFVRNLDHLIYFQISRKIPIPHNSKKSLKNDIRTILVGSHSTLKTINQKLKKLDIKSTIQVEDFWHHSTLFFMELTKKSIPLLADVLSLLSDHEQKVFIRSLQENVKRKSSLEDEQEKWRKRLKHYLGQVSSSQEKILERFLGYAQNRRLKNLTKQQNFLQKTQDFYSSQKTKEQKKIYFEQELAHLFNFHFKDSRSGDYLIELLKTLGPKQKIVLKSHLKEATELIDYFLDHFHR